MRLVFTANQVGSTSEVGIFYVDYTIDSNLTYQIRTIKPATLSEFSNPLPTNQHELINGFVVFRTLDIDDNASFFNALTPPVTDVTGTGSSTYTDYEITDTPAGGSSVSSDFSLSAMSHGTGLLVPGAYNVIPPVGVDELSVLSAINYPWRVGTNLKSTDNLATIPSKLFSQFMLTAPMGDRDSTVKEENFPVYLSKIRRLDSGASSLQLFFSTENTIIGSTSDATIEFATMILSRGDIGTNGPGTLIEIEPYNNLRDNTDASAALFSQNFGSGFVILSSEWATNTDIDSFFASFESIVDEPADRTFEAQLNEFALHRTPLNIPTIGEAQALAGSTSRRSSPIYPSNDNRYVVESDQGLGDKINFNEDSSITPNDDINPIAYKGSLVRKSVVLLVNTANTANFDYDNDILPRLKILFGRNLVHGDEWWDGTTFKRYDQISDTWIG
jgi:hypothetical protein